MSLLKIPIAAHAFTTSTYTPMECLNIDFIGPFPDGGFILVIVDTFTRWVELFPTIDATAASAAQALLHHFGRFGAPSQLRSDNGPHFIADLIREFLSLIGTQHCLTLVYSKQENSIIEI
jgi:transposase InsO family protein